MSAKLLLALSLCAVTLSQASACTLWGAAGGLAQGGTLMAKNRDWAPDHRQYLKKVLPRQGLRYFGLYAEGNKDPGLKAGINEKGLAIVSASSNIPRKLRDSQSDMHGVMIAILTGYNSVDAVAADASRVFSHSRANFFMISDQRKVLSVEVGLEGRYTLKLTNNGPIAHTNHYLDPQLASIYNTRIGISSVVRFDRINTLLAQQPAPITLDQFSVISRDHHDGPNNSLWRNGREVTMASWLLATPAAGAPRLRVVIANPGEPEIEQDLVLDEKFWQQVGAMHSAR